jgi:hypothetical protein
MATTYHKTFGGMRRAAERLIAELEAGAIDPLMDDRQYRRLDERTSAILQECDALWSNPADADEARRIANRVRDAWHKATA